MSSTASSRLRFRLGYKLLALFLLLAMAVSAIFVLGMQRAFSGGWQAWVRPLVADYAAHLMQDIGSPPDLQRAQALAERLPLRIRIDGPDVHWRSDRRRPETWDEDGPTGHAQTHERFRGEMRGWLWRQRTPDGYTVRFGFARFPVREEPRFMALVTLGLLLSLTALAYVTVRHWLRPLQDIHAGAARFGGGDFSTPIPVRRRDELGQVAEQVNTMAASIHQMLEAKRTLLLAISHELRSPLTRARLNAELAAPVPPAAADAVQAHAALLDDLACMRDLVIDLLETERLSAGHAALQRSPTDLPALVGDVVGEVAGDVVEALGSDVAGAQPRGSVRVQIEDDARALVAVPVDAVRLRLALRNLLANALRHQPADAGPVSITLTSRDGRAVFTVRDHGPGVPPEQLGQLGEPFHRVDSARSRSTGGVGLGLHLCQLVARAHGGTLDLRNASPGFAATLVLPMTA